MRLTALLGLPIIVRVCGGLGNQLFQVGFGEWLRHRFKRTLIFDATHMHRTSRAPVPERIWGESRLALAPTQLGWYAPLSASGKCHRWTVGLARRMQARRMPEVLLDRDGLAAVDTLHCPPLLVRGYWQSARYIDAAVLPVIERRLNAIARDYAGESGRAADHGVAVHLRWSDYKSDPHNRVRHGLLGMEYYRRALESFGRERPVTVFSEDLDAVAWFRAACGNDDVQWAGAKGTWEDFFAMSRFQRIVIANSSFSWWAAAYRGRSKQVVMPAQWFSVDPSYGRARSNLLRREGWLQMENDWL